MKSKFQGIASLETESYNEDDEEGAKEGPDFEKLVSYLGQFGPYQRCLYFLLWIPAAAMAIGIYASVFLEYVPNHHCSSTCLQDDHEWLSNLQNPSCTIPRSLNESCQIDDLSDVVACHKFTYDTSIFTRTVITDFDAVCGNSFKRTIRHVVQLTF